MSGKNITVYLNGGLYKYYQFYQIYGDNFLGFNGNDMEYLKFDAADIEEGEIRLYTKPKEMYHITIKSWDGEKFDYISYCTDSFINALVDVANRYEAELADIDVKEIHMGIEEGI